MASQFSHWHTLTNFITTAFSYLLIGIIWIFIRKKSIKISGIYKILYMGYYMQIRQHPDGSVFVSKCGRVFKELRYFERGNTLVRYLHVVFNKKKCDVHRLVAETFIKNTDNKPWVLHTDDNKQNNKISNLRWGTPKENSADYIRNGRRNAPFKGRDKFKTPADRNQYIFQELMSGRSGRSIADEFGLNETRVSQLASEFRKRLKLNQ